MFNENNQDLKRFYTRDGIDRDAMRQPSLQEEVTQLIRDGIRAGREREERERNMKLLKERLQAKQSKKAVDRAMDIFMFSCLAFSIVMVIKHLIS